MTGKQVKEWARLWNGDGRNEWQVVNEEDGGARCLQNEVSRAEAELAAGKSWQLAKVGSWQKLAAGQMELAAGS